ncbi:hypothetical protein BVRB_5g117210 isoform B [Beta vulgaris subsp. vulgaris]|nr:hypothetical protein BVRB_5g117210 isoform B [Beta vulgaris subsp. vulgaris]
MNQCPKDVLWSVHILSVSALKRLQVDDLSNNGYELLYHWNLFHPV